MDVFTISKSLENCIKYIFYFFLGTVVLAIFSYSLLFLRSKLQKLKEDHETEKLKHLEEDSKALPLKKNK
jgi:hypothetical protein